MAVHLSREVLDNLLRLKQSLVEQEPIVEPNRRLYRMLFNPDTGEFVVKAADPRQYQSIQLDVQVEKANIAKFEVKDESGKPLEKQAMAPAAWRVMQETLQVLNQISAQYPSRGSLPERDALNRLPNIHLSPFFSIENLAGWKGAIDRLEAEEMLLGKSPGTYLLRRGEDCFAESLTEGNGMYIETYLCTYVESPEKIAEEMLLLTEMGWTLYRDNADLKDPEYLYHNSPQMLLHELSSHIRNPL